MFYLFTALPMFKTSTPEIIYKNTTAWITWSINNLDSVTSILIQVCLPDRSLCKPAINITSLKVQPYVIRIPEGDTHKYMFIFTLYDGTDIVNIITATGE